MVNELCLVFQRSVLQEDATSGTAEVRWRLVSRVPGVVGSDCGVGIRVPDAET